jgi:lipopolysaccharide export system protein LptC
MSQQADLQRSKRQKSAAPGGVRDKMIRFLRVALPSVIGAVLALLVFSPFSNTKEMSFVLDKKEVSQAKERMRITEAFYRGQDSEGRPFTLRAASAVQKSSDEPVVQMNDVTGQLQMNDGPAKVQIEQGSYDMDKDIIRATGPMTLNNSNGSTVTASNITVMLKNQKVESVGPMTYNDGRGFSMTANNVILFLKNKTIESFGPVNGRTRVGTFRGGKLRADMNNRVLRLENGAHLQINQGAIR